MTVRIHEASLEEHAAAGEATARAYREFVAPGEDDWSRYLTHIADVSGRAGRTMVLVAVEDDRVLGSVTLELDARVSPDDDPLDPWEAHVRMLGVDPSERGSRLGRLLMAECEARARAAGRTLVTLNTTPRMKAARSLYESLGYVRGEDLVFPDGFVLLSYSKTLD